jgi:sec-independent protein translocase protein TatB
MFDIGWSELHVIAVVAIIVIGPKDLPKVMRTVGHSAGKLRRAAADFQRQFEDAMRESEIEEVKKAIESARTDVPPVDLKAPIDKPVMLPKPQQEKELPAKAQEPAAAAPKTGPVRKRAAAKPKTGSAPRRARKRAEPSA